MTTPQGQGTPAGQETETGVATVALAAITDGASEAPHHRPWPRFIVSEEAWCLAGEALARRDLVLLGYWGEATAAHLALADPSLGDIRVITHECRHLRVPSVAALYPPAARLERTLYDLHGLIAEGAPDRRPWLDHGRWRKPPRRGPAVHGDTGAPYTFLPVEGEGLHRIPVGPVHAGIIEPGHFRFTCNGETVVRLEARLGWVHKGIETLVTWAPPEKAARLIGRVSGDSTVAYAIAFARACEAASGTAPPPRAHLLRGLMAELERIANHLGDIGAVCNDAAFALMLASCGILRENVLRAAERCFGHRLMMDRVMPGGVVCDLTTDGAADLLRLVTEIARALPELFDLYDNTASLQDRTVGTGILRPEFAQLFGCGGFVGRASGQARDVRRSPGYPPYEATVVRRAGARGGGRGCSRPRAIHRGGTEFGAHREILDRLPAGPIRSEACQHAPAAFARAWRWSRASAATSSSGCACAPTEPSTAAISATRLGSSGRCSRQRSRATSSPISRSAINRSTAPTRARSLSHAQNAPPRPGRSTADGSDAAAGRSRYGRTGRHGSRRSVSAGSAGASPSAKWTQARATAASWRSTR